MDVLVVGQKSVITIFKIDLVKTKSKKNELFSIFQEGISGIGNIVFHLCYKMLS